MGISRGKLRLAVVLFIVALCLVALTISQTLMAIHAPIRLEADRAAWTGMWGGMCGGDEGGGGGCEDVIKSEYGFVHLKWWGPTTTQTVDEHGEATKRTVIALIPVKVPVAQIGQCYYVFMLAWFALTGVPRRNSRWWHLLPLVLAVGAVGVSIYFCVVMAWKLEAWCRLCLLLHVIDVLLCVAVVVLWPGVARRGAPPAADEAGEPGLSFGHAAAAICCAGAVIFMSFLHRNDQMGAAVAYVRASRCEQSMALAQKDTRLTVGALRGVDAENIPRRDTEAPQGPPDSPYELIIFSDLECPACRHFETQVMPHVLRLWKGQLKVVFRHYPLCRDCNPNLGPNSKINHTQACRAAYATEAARMVGGAKAFWAMHDTIIEKHEDIRQEGFGDRGFVGLAKELGLNEAAFKAAYEGQEVRDIVAGDIAAGRTLRISGTPTVFLHGRRLTSQALQVVNMEFWKAVARNAVGPLEGETQAAEPETPDE